MKREGEEKRGVIEVWSSACGEGEFVSCVYDYSLEFVHVHA